jgi:hypothetical protein
MIHERDESLKRVVRRRNWHELRAVTWGKTAPSEKASAGAAKDADGGISGTEEGLGSYSVVGPGKTRLGPDPISVFNEGSAGKMADPALAAIGLAVAVTRNACCASSSNYELRLRWA